MEEKKKFRPNPDSRLMDQVQEVMRYYHYAYRTEQTYCDWIKRYLRFFECEKHPREMNSPEVERFLSHLATEVSRCSSRFTVRMSLMLAMCGCLYKKNGLDEF